MDDFHPAELVERCLAGDAESFTPLVRRYQNAAFVTALRYARSRSEAQDIVQDALVAAYCRLGQLREPARFGGWLMHIVANRGKDWLRQQGRMQPLEEADWLGAAAAIAEHDQRQQRRELQEAIDLLPEHYRATVLMYYLSGLSYREIAEFMDVPQSTVRGRLQQGRLRLRRLLEDTPLAEREIDMQPIDVSEKVRQTVCQIATQQVRQVVPLEDTEHIVFNCAIDGDLEIRPAEGDKAVLEGTLSSFGPTMEQAQASVGRIEIAADQVDNFLDSGPHEGEIFLGTQQKDEEISAAAARSSQLWQSYVAGDHVPWGLYNGLQSRDVFPYLQDYKLSEEMRASLGRVTRLTVLRRQVEDIVLSKSAFTPEVQRVFHPNSVNDTQVHGAVGFASLVLYVPKGKRVTVIKGPKVRAYGLQGDLACLFCYCEELADIVGDIELFDSGLESARRIRGRLRQRHYRYPTMHSDTNEAYSARNERADCLLEEIDGEVDIEIGRAQIEAAELTGRVRIANRYGQTRLHQTALGAEERVELESCSGDIRLFLKGDLADQVQVTAFTLCGRFEFDALKGRGLNRSNNDEAALLSTLHGDADILGADLLLKSESGTIIIEKTR